MADVKKRKPYTVVLDWEYDWWDSEAADIRATMGGDDDPQVFHVWAGDACDASDFSDEMAAEKFGETVARYLKHVAILHGHAPLVRNGE